MAMTAIPNTTCPLAGTSKINPGVLASCFEFNCFAISLVLLNRYFALDYIGTKHFVKRILLWYCYVTTDRWLLELSTKWRSIDILIIGWRYIIIYTLVRHCRNAGPASHLRRRPSTEHACSPGHIKAGSLLLYNDRPRDKLTLFSRKRPREARPWTIC